MRSILRIAIWVAALTLFLWPNGYVRGALTVKSQPLVTFVNPGQSGFFEIAFVNTDGTRNIDGFGVSVAITGTGVSFTSVDNQTVLHPYIFGDDGDLDDLTFETFPNSTFGLSDFVIDPPGSKSIAAGTYGLARVGFEVDHAAVAGTREIVLSDFYFEIDGEYSVDLESGFIEVQIMEQASVVPEPGTLSVFGIFSILLGASSIGRRNRQRNKNLRQSLAT